MLTKPCCHDARLTNEDDGPRRVPGVVWAFSRCELNVAVDINEREPLILATLHSAYCSTEDRSTAPSNARCHTEHNQLQGDSKPYGLAAHPKGAGSVCWRARES